MKWIIQLWRLCHDDRLATISEYALSESTNGSSNYINITNKSEILFDVTLKYFLMINQAINFAKTASADVKKAGLLGKLQYIQRNMHTVFALLCFVVVIHWLIFPYPSGLLHWHCGNLTIAPVPAKQPWWIWINTSCEFIMNDCITTTKQSTTKPCAYFLGYTVCQLQIFTYRIDRKNCQTSLLKVIFLFLKVPNVLPIHSLGEWPNS